MAVFIIPEKTELRAVLKNQKWYDDHIRSSEYLTQIVNFAAQSHEEDFQSRKRIYHRFDTYFETQEIL
jgi:hypothetical protein